MTLQVAYSGQFKRDLKTIQKRGKDITRLKILMSLLVEDSPPTDFLS